jgi:hypothetical protein
MFAPLCREQHGVNAIEHMPHAHLQQEEQFVALVQFADSAG